MLTSRRMLSLLLAASRDLGCVRYRLGDSCYDLSGSGNEHSSLRKHDCLRSKEDFYRSNYDAAFR